MDQEIIDKVLRECQNSLKITERRFAMLKNIHKDQRPYNHEEVVESWEEGIRQYKKKPISPPEGEIIKCKNCNGTGDVITGGRKEFCSVCGGVSFIISKKDINNG